MLLRLLSTIWLLLPGTQADHQVPLGLQKVSISTDDLPPPPDPEPVAVTRLPLPPIAPSDDAGSCSLEINPHGTGCFGKVSKLQSGSFLPDNNHSVCKILWAHVEQRWEVGAPPQMLFDMPGASVYGTS